MAIGDFRVVMDPAAIQAFVVAGNGPVVRKLLDDGERVKLEAKRLVGKKTRNLEHHIVKRIVQIDGQPACIVGFESVPYGLFHHEGTEPHDIYPRRARVLVFYWPKAGRTVAFRHVHHPGTRPNRFLLNALRVLR